MRTLWGILFAGWVLLASPMGATAEVNGDLEEVDGKYVLTVWGTHAERGYAVGRLLGPQAKEVFDEYFIDFFCGGSAHVYNYLRSVFTSYFAVDAKYVTEAEAVFAGMVDGGVDPYNATLGRDLDAVDFLVTNSIVDLSQFGGNGLFGCSSLSSWGASTAADPELEGHLVITRHLDWSRHASLTDNAVILVHLPAEEDEQKWVSMSYAGVMGTLSGVSESSVGAFLNMGNNASGNQGQPYHPILYTLRSGLEMADYDGDEEHTAADIEAAIADRSRCAAVIIHTVRDEGEASEPVIVECNNSAGVATRTQSDNTLVPGEHLVATNHFRVLYEPVPCYRYAAIADSLTENQEMTATRSWNVMAHAAGQSSNIMAIQYIPSHGELACAVDTYAEPAYLQDPTLFDLDELFAYTPAAADDSPPTSHPALEAHPNPFQATTTLALPAGGRIDIFDMSGRRVRTLRAGESARVVWDGTDDLGRAVSSGCYLCRVPSDARGMARKVLLAD